MKLAPPNRVTRTYLQRLHAEPAAVFALLCPVREAEWIDDWDPVVVFSASGVAEPDCVFVTRSEHLDAVWYVTRHEPERHCVEMLKVTPEVTACRLTIQVRPAPGGSEAEVTYRHTSLGPRGDEFVAAFTEESYERFMKTWERQMNHFLQHGTPLRSG